MSEQFAIAVSRFNEHVTRPLLEEAKKGFASKGIKELKIVWVPGAFELPFAAKLLAKTKKYAAIVCLGAVIRGETTHYDYVCQQASSGILQVSLETQTPVIFSVLTTENDEQARARLNVGFSGALAALEMASLVRELQ